MFFNLLSLSYIAFVLGIHVFLVKSVELPLCNSGIISWRQPRTALVSNERTARGNQIQTLLVNIHC